MLCLSSQPTPCPYKSTFWGCWRGALPLRTPGVKGTPMARRSPEKTARFELRCSLQELAIWRTTAKNCGMPLAQFIRECVTQHLPVAGQQDSPMSCLLSSKTPQNYPVHFRKADPILIRQLAAIGNNLNQITHWANTHKSQQEAKPVEEEVRLTRKALERILDGEDTYVD